MVDIMVEYVQRVRGLGTLSVGRFKLFGFYLVLSCSGFDL